VDDQRRVCEPGGGQMMCMYACMEYNFSVKAALGETCHARAYLDGILPICMDQNNHCLCILKEIVGFSPKQ
jgi:hypothetical protein